MSTITIWAAAISNRVILIAFVICIWWHFPWHTHSAVRIQLAASISSTYNFEGVIIGRLSWKISRNRWLRPWRCPHHSLLMLSLIGFQLLIQRLYFGHVVLLHGRHCVGRTPGSSIGLLSFDWLLSPIVLTRCPLRTLFACSPSPSGSPLHLVLPLSGHLVTGLLEYALIILYLPLYVSLELTHPILCVHFRHYTRLWLCRVIAFREWIGVCQLLCRLRA